MRNLRTLYLFVYLMWLLVGTPTIATAANNGKSNHVPTGKILEFSLLNLKESLQKTMQKNNRLEFENAVLREDIEHLQRTLEDLMVKKAKLLGEPLPVFDRQKQDKYSKPLDLQAREAKTEDLIRVFEQDIANLKERIYFLKSRLDKSAFNVHMKQLKKKRQMTQKNVKRLKHDLEALRRKNRGPLKTIETLENEQRVLERQMSMHRSEPIRY